MHDPLKTALFQPVAAKWVPQTIWHLSASFISSAMTPLPTMLFAVTEQLELLQRLLMSRTGTSCKYAAHNVGARAGE